jgi:hypothetical protein
MLILDKHKAVEQMVALTAKAEAVSSEEGPAAAGVRTHRKVATYERRRAAMNSAAEPPPTQVRRRARHAGGTSPA